ncbi:MAG: tetratricopeptide repeat protein [Planctomycetota bacterium]
MNTKFVLALCGVLVLMVGGVVAVWYTIESRSPERYVQMAEQSYAEGDLRKAISFYGRAVHRRPNDLALLDRYAELLTQAEVSSLTNAQNYLRLYTGSIRQATERAGYTDERLDNLYATMLELSRRFRAQSYNNQIIEQASNRLAFDPDNLPARKYRGIATLGQLVRDAPLDVRDRALEDLTFAAEQQPNDPDVIWALALWKLREADRIDQPGNNVGDRPEEADRLRQEALDLGAALLAVDPADPVRQMRYIELMADNALNPDQLVPHPNGQAIRQVADAVVLQAGAAADHDPVALAGLINVLPRLYTERVEGDGPPMSEGVAMAAAMLANANQQGTDHLALMFFEAELDRRAGRADRAFQGYERVIDSGAAADFITFLEGQSIVPRAYQSKGELLLSQIDPSDEAAASQTLDQVDEIADQLATMVGEESPPVDILRGKTLLFRGQIAKSIAYLDRANARLGDANPELLLLSAQARMRSGQPGAAAERYDRLLEIRPEANGARLEYARLLFSLDEPQRAREQLAIVLEADPDNELAAQIMTAVTLRSGQGNVQAAIEQLERDAEAGGLEELTRLAAAYLEIGQNEKAADAAKRALAIDPTHLPAIRTALTTDTDPDTRRAIAQAAADGGMEQERVDMILSVIELAETGDPNVRRSLVEQMIANNDDPVRAGLTEARLYIDSENEDDAQRGRAALDELIASHGDHPSVIEYRFGRALQAEDYPLAEQIADLAEQTDADLAGGLFYQARLLEAQGQTDRAVLTMTNALEARPIYSQGWTRLGRLHRAAGQPEQALDALERAVEQSPGNLPALLALTQLSVELGRFDQALDAARTAARRAPGNREIQRLTIGLEQQHGDIDLAIQRRTEWAERYPDDVENLRQLALAHAKQGEVELALDALDRSATGEENPLELVRARATVYSLGGDAQKGLEVLQGYLQARGDQVTTEDLTALAAYFIQNDRRDLAIQALNRARQGEDPETMPASRAMGDLLFNAGRNETAARLYADVLAASPEDQAVRLRLAETHLRLDQLDQAGEVLDDPSVQDSSTAKLVKALIARQDNDLPTAMRLVNQLIAAEPERADLYLHRGSILARQEGRTQTAIEDLERSLALNPDSTLARLTLANLLAESGNPSGAIDELQRLVARSPDYRRGHAVLAQTLIAAGRPRDAEIVLGSAAARFDDDPAWPRQLGRLAASRGQTDDAVEAYRQALSLSRNPADLVSLTEALLAAGRHAEALSGLETLSPELAAVPNIRVLRGVALHRLGRSNEALAEFQQSIQDTDSLGVLTGVVGRIAGELPNAEVVSMVDTAANDERRAMSQIAAATLLVSDDADDAMQRLRGVEAEAVADPALEGAWYRAGAIAAYTLDDFGAADTMYQRVLELNPNDASSLNNYAFMLISNLDQPQRGLELAERAVRLLPQNARVLDTLGLAELHADRVQDAILTLQRSRQLERLGVNTLHLGMAYAQAGRYTDARDMFEQAIQIGEAEGDADTAASARERLASLADPSANVE